MSSHIITIPDDDQLEELVESSNSLSTETMICYSILSVVGITLISWAVFYGD